MSQQRVDDGDLSEIFPDLSSSQQQEQKHRAEQKVEDIPGSQPRKLVKTNNDKPSSNAPKIIAPSFLGGGFFKPPPPPTSGRVEQKQFVDEQHKNPHFPPRQRKNTIYVKNVPKNLNKFDRLMTFFRNYGGIKNIKTSDETNSAFVRFEKEQDALRFVNSQALVFNRPYIAYATQQDFQVSAQNIKQREKEDNASMKPVEKEAIILRESTETIVADKYRCLLFLLKEDYSGNLKESIQEQMRKCRKLKEAEINDQEANNLLAQFSNDYDWTLVFSQLTKTQIDKKKLIQLYNKYGPISSIHIKLTTIPEGQKPGDLAEGEEEKLGVIKLKFLSVRSSWKMYQENKANMDLEVQGQKLNQIYHNWKLNQNFNPKIEEQNK